MGFFGDIFQGKPETQQIVDTVPPEFTGLRGPLATNLQQLLQGPSFQGPLVAPLGGQEQGFLNQIMGLAGQTPQLEQAGTNLLQKTLGGDFLNPGSNPFLQSMFEAAARPVTRNFQDVVLPDLRAQFTRAGQFIQPGSSSPFAAALGRAGTGFGENMADLAAQIFGPAYLQERGLMQSALPMAAQFSSLPFQRAGIGLEAAGAPRQIEDIGIQRAIQEFERQTGRRISAAEIAAALTMPQTQQITQGARSSPFEQFADVVGTGAKLAGSVAGIAGLFSDRRLKRDVVPIDGTLRGFQLYQFKYLWSPETHVGVMADEVEPIMPEAVSEVDGFKVVDYGRLVSGIRGLF